MSDAPTVNGLRCVSARIIHPWRGVWMVDAQLDPDVVQTVQTFGPASALIGGSTLTGVIDPRGSGTFVAGAAVRVLGGAGGWDKTVPSLHFHNDAGLLSSTIYNATAATVLETVVDAIPVVLGIDYMRPAGPASRVFGDNDWWVDLLGTTHTGPRPPAVADPTLTVLNWDPVQQRAELTCDALVLPGTPLVDTRFNGVTPIVRDVEQTFDAHGSRILAWCAQNPASRLLSALTSMVRELGKTATLKVYRYRLVLEGADKRITLQAVNPTAGMPAATLPLSVWPGMQGDSADYNTIGAEVLVHFVEGPAGTPSQPVVLGFSPGIIPTDRTVDAQGLVKIGPSAAAVELAGGTEPLVLAPWATGLVGALEALATALSGFGPLASAGAALTTALGALPPAGSNQVFGR